ncbi:hypothetical protein BDF19DRAFT_497921 [Syncephalis fuscata]|nr:hypothetical protein BDF19DRAFT_497921 [Syncephalis fuscata]
MNTNFKITVLLAIAALASTAVAQSTAGQQHAGGTQAQAAGSRPTSAFSAGNEGDKKASAFAETPNAQDGTNRVLTVVMASPQMSVAQAGPFPSVTDSSDNQVGTTPSKIGSSTGVSGSTVSSGTTSRSSSGTSTNISSKTVLSSTSSTGSPTDTSVSEGTRVSTSLAYESKIIWGSAVALVVLTPFMALV